MDNRYELYCLTDRLFYDSPRVTRATDFEVSHRPLPTGWRQVPGEEWMLYEPPVARMPVQGWKVHVSGCAESADLALEKTWDHCIPRGISFKHLRGPGMLHMRNAKYASRGASGKLVTIYPADEAEFERVLSELGASVAGLTGPYILSDLRIGAGPLYVRYGGFADRRCPDDRGELVSAMEDGDGRLVPDRREPVFTVPAWVTPPAVLETHLAARTATSTTQVPYQVVKALHFSNGGGVYVAKDERTGEEVILKEARPYAGLAADGADAVTRLQRERDTLTALAGIEGVPAVHDYFTLGEHHFLAQELVPGRTLNTFFAERHPLLDPEPEPGKVAGYTAWALNVYEGVERIIKAIHGRGIVFNDLHMFNVMVRPDDTVALIDFEVAAPASDHGRQTLANPAFLSPGDRRGEEVDHYSLACLKLALFLPMTTLFVLDRGKAAQLADVIAESFPVPRDGLEPAVRMIARGAQVTPLPELGTAPLTRAILASATPDRADRLFPGDVAQFGGAGLGLSNGAAGVLYALAATGSPRHPRFEEWLAERAFDPPQGTGLGLYDGLLGAAYVLAGLGHTDAALRAVDHCLAEKWERLGSDLYGGLPGYALALDHLADVTGEPTLRDTAWRAAELVAGRGTIGSPRPGLMYGGAGEALMYLRRYDRTGEAALLELAATALRRDLRDCVYDNNGALHVDQGFRVLPYLGRGSVGIGLVLDEYLAIRPDEEFASARAAIRIAARSPYYAQPSLFGGRAGMILYLSRQDAADPWVERHVRSLAWHALGYGDDGLAFPGEHLYRLSMDLATGTAGVLLALGAARLGRPVHLPFFATAHELPVESPTGSTSIRIAGTTACGLIQPERK